MEAISNAVDQGAKVIIADGYSFEDVVYNAQKEYPDVNFILIDAEPVDGESGGTRTCLLYTSASRIACLVTDQVR